MSTGTDLLFELVTATPTGTAGLHFGRVDAAGRVYLDPGDSPIAGTPVSLVPLRPGSRFAALKQGETLIIIGLVGGADSTPTGVVTAFAGPAASVPPGWLLCDGQVVSRTTYAALFAAIGGTYGTGDGSTTFAMPDYRGRVLVGLDSTDPDFATLGQIGGTSEAQLPLHSHGVSGNFNLTPYHAPPGYEFSGDGHSWSSIETDDAGVSNATNLQPYRVASYIIRT